MDELELNRMHKVPPPDYWYLCLVCGAIGRCVDWEALRYADQPDGEYALEPAPPGWEDPILRCPSCRWEHADNDSGPGIIDGTRAEVEAAREHERTRDDRLRHEWAGLGA